MQAQTGVEVDRRKIGARRAAQGAGRGRGHGAAPRRRRRRPSRSRSSPTTGRLRSARRRVSYLTRHMLGVSRRVSAPPPAWGRPRSFIHRPGEIGQRLSPGNTHGSSRLRDPQAASLHRCGLGGAHGAAGVRAVRGRRRNGCGPDDRVDAPAPSQRTCPAAQPRGRGVAARRDAAVARRDRCGGRGAGRGHRLLQARARAHLRRDQSLYGQGEPADPVTVADELRRADLLDALGGRGALLRLQAGTPASANAAHYARIVNELALLAPPHRRRGRHRRDGLRRRPTTSPRRSTAPSRSCSRSPSAASPTR